MNRFEKLVGVLAERKWTVTAAESCTGGLFCASIVEIADASKVLERGFVTYSEEAKCELVGVSPDTITEFGVVSEETAAEMAAGAAAAAHADVGVGITGYAGPGGGDRFAACGTVCFGFCVKGSVHTERVEYHALGRNEVRSRSAAFACDALLTLLETEDR